MKYLTNKIILYILIVVLPLVLFTGYFSIEIYHRDSLERNNEAKRVAEIHEENWNEFIEQTVTILDMLSLTIHSVQDSPEEIDSLLQKGTGLDPRYAGMFLLDTDGNVINGDKSLLVHSNLGNQSYIQEVLRTKDVIISDQPEIFAKGQNVVGIAQPVLDHQQHILFVVVAYLKTDYIKSILQTMFPNKHYHITNSKNEIVIEGNPSETDQENQLFYTLSIDRIPWEIQVAIHPINHQKLLKIILSFVVILAIFFHSIYFLANYFIQQRRTKKEKKQNDLQKLELLGTFSASLAHEIRNPLTGIKGLVQLLSETHRDEKDQTFFSIIDKELNRINEIVNEFLILGKPSPVKTDKIDMRNIITELVPLIEYEASRNKHKLNILIPEDPLYIKASKDQMKQVLLNISKNALESMTKNGAITIELQQVCNEVCLSVSDKGHGISPKQMKRIFQPFYTSKETGTGLGLVICKRIIESMDGKIELKSKLNEGTTIMIKLPIIQLEKTS